MSIVRCKAILYAIMHAILLFPLVAFASSFTPGQWKNVGQVSWTITDSVSGNGLVDTVTITPSSGSNSTGNPVNFIAEPINSSNSNFTTTSTSETVTAKISGFYFTISGTMQIGVYNQLVPTIQTGLER